MKHKKTFFTLLIILVLGAGGYYSVKSGQVEYLLSTTSVPFNWFVKPPQKLNATQYEIHNISAPNIKASKQTLAPYTKDFRLNKKAYPKIGNLFTNQTVTSLSKIYDSIYGRPNTYIAHSCVSGMFLDYQHTWQPIVTLSAVDDSNKIFNQSYVFVMKNHKVIDIIKLGQKSTKYWTEPINTDYKFAKINQAQNKVETLFNTNKIINKGIDISKQAQSAQAYLQAGVASQIIITSDPDLIQFVYTVPVKSKLVYLTVNYNQTNETIKSII